MSAPRSWLPTGAATGSAWASPRSSRGPAARCGSRSTATWPGQRIQSYVRDHWAGVLHELGVEVIPYAELYGVDGKTVYPVACHRRASRSSSRASTRWSPRSGHDPASALEEELGGLGLRDARDRRLPDAAHRRGGGAGRPQGRRRGLGRKLIAAGERNASEDVGSGPGKRRRGWTRTEFKGAAREASGVIKEATGRVVGDDSSRPRASSTRPPGRSSAAMGRSRTRRGMRCARRAASRRSSGRCMRIPSTLCSSPEPSASCWAGSREGVVRGERSRGAPRRREAGVTTHDLAEIYRGYIACLNGQAWANLGQFVGDDAQHNGKRIGLSGYRHMLEQDFRDIPDLRFTIELLASDPPFVASSIELRLHADRQLPRARRQRQARILRRERVLPVRVRQDRRSLVDRRQEGRRSAAPGPFVEAGRRLAAAGHHGAGVGDPNGGWACQARRASGEPRSASGKSRNVSSVTKCAPTSPVTSSTPQVI